MSPNFVHARTSIAPISIGRTPLCAGGIITTIITTGTGTTGSGWAFVRK